MIMSPNATGESYVDLYAVVPGADIDYTRYWESEKNILNPALEKAGYVLTGAWWTSDGDSFGPLVRAIRAIKDDKKVIITYG